MVTKKRLPSRHVFPMGLKLALVGVTVFVIALLIAGAAMRGYLETAKALKEANHKKVLAEHPLAYSDLIVQYAAANNLEPAFVSAIIMAESSYRRDAESSVGARGLMQLMPDTAKWIAGKLNEGDTYTFERMFDPETNIRFGTWYLNFLAERFLGDPVLVASAYHAGQGEVQNMVSAGAQTLNDLPDGPTKNYARKVTTAYGIYQNLYFSDDAEIDLPADGI